jgi:hypothetical protein
MQHLKVIAQGPHPVGSVEHAAVANYLHSQLRELGVSAEVQDTTGATNILARLQGRTQGKAVLLVGHYDTVPMSPGASDDGSAIAAMLETLRALEAGAPLKNDVIFLFSDGEEVGSAGAKAFVYRHPWAKEVAVVLNFEARGTSGPAILFETSNENGWLIAQFATAAVHPVANSLSYEIYRMLPHDTDLTIFKEAGYAGLNFAFINDSQHYHTAFDNLANIDQNSLQHQGSYALALTRHLGNSNLENVRAPDYIYFDLIGITLIRYSEKWVKPLAALILILFVGTMSIGARKGVLTGRGALVGFGAVLAIMIGTVLSITLLWWVINALRSQPTAAGSSADFDIAIYAVAATAVASVLYVVFCRQISVSNLMAGGLIWWLLGMILTSVYLQGGSYLFSWPLLFSTVALAITFMARGGQIVSKKHLSVLALGAIPGVVLIAPIIYLTCIALTTRSFSSVLVIALSAVALLGPLIPHIKITARLNRGWH